MRVDFWGGGGGLPRAVPSDAVVALLDERGPGHAPAEGRPAGRAGPRGRGGAPVVGPVARGRLTAVSVAVWNPFVVERLLIGHWPVLLGYAVLPWVVVLLRRAHARGPPAGRGSGSLVPLGCLSASAGLVTAVALLVLGLRGGMPHRLPGRGWSSSLSPPTPRGWWPGCCTPRPRPPRSTEPSSRRTARARCRSPLAALGLGGIWNSEVVPCVPRRARWRGWGWPCSGPARRWGRAPGGGGSACPRRAACCAVGRGLGPGPVHLGRPWGGRCPGRGRSGSRSGARRRPLPGAVPAAAGGHHGGGAEVLVAGPGADARERPWRSASPCSRSWS